MYIHPAEFFTLAMWEDLLVYCPTRVLGNFFGMRRRTPLDAWPALYVAHCSGRHPEWIDKAIATWILDDLLKYLGLDENGRTRPRTDEELGEIYAGNCRASREDLATEVRKVAVHEAMKRVIPRYAKMCQENLEENEHARKRAEDRHMT